jgi:hypothetical protein
MKKVLVLGGGGAKGAIQIMALKEHQKRVGMPLWSYYDLIVGTSVGSIHGALIASGKVSIDFLNMTYNKFLQKIFKTKHLFHIPKYDRMNFIDLWAELVGLNFLMKDVKTKLLVTSVDICENVNHYFKSWEEKDGNELLFEIVMRSFAAPYYFGHLHDYKNHKVWSDGGIGTSNLSIEEALVECVLLNWTKENLHFDVMGCGFINDNIAFKDAIKFKSIKELFKFIDPANGGLARSQSREDKIRRIIKLGNSFTNFSFDYWDVEINSKHDGMDKIQYFKEYQQYGKVMGFKPLISLGRSND